MKHFYPKSLTTFVPGCIILLISLFYLNNNLCYGQTDSLLVEEEIITPQGGCPGAQVFPSYVSMGAAGGVEYITIQPDCSNWDITNYCAWVSAYKSGNRAIVTVSANGGPARSVVIYVADLPVMISQACGDPPPGSAGAVSGANSVCKGQTGVTYYVSPITKATGYQWTLPSGATITSGYNTNSITVNYATSAVSGYISVRGTGCGTGASSPGLYVSVNALTAPGSISGPASVCDGKTYTYSVSPVAGASRYTWTIPSGASGSSSTNTINVTFGSTSGSVTVQAHNNVGCISANRSLGVTVASTLRHTVQGGGEICQWDSASVNLNNSAWGIKYRLYKDGVLQPSETKEGTEDPLTWNNLRSAGVYTVRAVPIEGCEIQMNGSATIIVRPLSTPPSSITVSTSTTICPGSSSTLTVNGGWLAPGANWHWFENNPWSNPVFVGNPFTASPSSTTTYYVRAVGPCNSAGPASITITVASPPAITTQPRNSIIYGNEDASFSVTASGLNLRYQWQVLYYGESVWTDLSGLPATGYMTPNLTIKGSYSLGDNLYRCKIISDCGTLYSDAATIIKDYLFSGYISQPQDPEAREINTNYSPGSPGGSLNVNLGGGSSYSIPIDLPAGVNGLSPAISVVYSSNSGNGVGGFGWHIAGISSITRGPHTFYHDVKARGVELDNSDRFYLDGQRLVNSEANYGDANAVYYTDNDIFTRVTPRGVSSNGPAWFKAETKNGLIYEYGNLNFAQQRIAGYPQILSWYVSRISDLSGNHIDFTYIRDHASIYPYEITYGPNTIVFNYKGRPDNMVSFIKGKKVEQQLALDNIVVKYNSEIIRKYEFKHHWIHLSYDPHILLKEVTEYGFNGDRYNSTLFSYELPGEANFVRTKNNTTNQNITYKSKMWTGDFNGDGKVDFLCLPDTDKGTAWSGIRVLAGDGNDNFFYLFGSNVSIHLDTLRDLRVLDLDADGKDDIVYEYGIVTTSLKILLNKGDSFAPPSLMQYGMAYSSSAGLSGKSRRTVDRQEDDNERRTASQLTLPWNRSAFIFYGDFSNADYNGDGINDIFYNLSDGRWSIYSFGSSGQLLSVLHPLGSGTISTLSKDVLSNDFNGDGKADIWSFENNGMNIYTLNDTTLELLYHSDSTSNKHFFTLGDFNGDGKTDIFIYGYGKGETKQYDWQKWEIHLSTGTGFEKHKINRQKDNLKNDYVRIADFDGNGTHDIMVTSGDESWTGTHFYFTHKNGTTFFTKTLSNFPPASHNYYVNDFDGDGKMDILCTDGKSPWENGYQIYKNTSKSSILMDKISDGLGVLTKLEYVRLTQATFDVYKAQPVTSFRVLNMNAPIALVKSVYNENGAGDFNRTNYYYEGAKVNIQGKGFMGFLKTRVTEVVSGIQSESISQIDGSYYYPKVVKTFSRYGSDTLEVTTNKWANKTIDPGTKRFFPYIQSSTHVDKLTGFSVSTSAEYDNFGNPTSVIKSYSSGKVETIRNVYQNTISPSKWLPGRADSTIVRYLSPGNSTITRRVSRTFDPNNNRLTDEVRHPGTDWEISEHYDYFSNGNLRAVTVTGGGKSRTTSYTYKSDNIRVATVTDPLSHVVTNNYDSHGRLHTQKDHLENTITYHYDNFGRQDSVSSSDGSRSSTKYIWEDPASNQINARYSVVSSASDGSRSKTWFDKLERNVRSDVKAFNGSWIYKSIKYDAKGQLHQVSDPYFYGETEKWNTFVYDGVGRKTGFQQSSGRNTTWRYEGSSVTETTGDRSSTKVYSSDGTISSVSDQGGTIEYEYYPDGKVKKIKAPGNITTEMKYDIAGNQTRLTDPSAGTITYLYNPFGELLNQTNPGNQSTSTEYYPDGRISKKITTEGEIRYRYNADKQLANIRYPEGVSQSYGYDSKGRITAITDSIPGTSPMVTSMGYDDLGRQSTVTHPSGIVETVNYNGNGYMRSVSSGGDVRWAITAADARHNVTATVYGSNLNASCSYDEYGYPETISAGTVQSYKYNFNHLTGNLQWRRDNNRNLREDFHYDNLDRLDSVYMGQVTTLVMSYGNNAGLRSKSDAGTFIYSPESPYAPDSISPATQLIQDPQDITYTSHQSIKTIDQDGFHAGFVYRDGDDRAKMTVSYNGGDLLTRYYSSGSYIREVTGSTLTEYTFIGGDAYSAPVVAITRNGATAYYNILRDYLGNITHVVNSTDNTLVAEYSYDPWGRLRNPATWEVYAPGSEPALIVAGRGYTGHEHLPWFSLINMNGRVYDPLIGMFLSPDNYVQMPGFTQNFNRYAYCLNNPLIYTDPDGEFLIPLLIGAAIGIITNGVDNVVHDRAFFHGAGKAALIGGIGGVLSFGIGQMAMEMSGLGRVAYQTVAHGHLGGIMSDFNGGSYGSGFLSGAFGSLAATGTGALLQNNSRAIQAIGTVGSGALSGGIGAEIAGGNFWDGFRNGAISSGLNHGIHSGAFGEGLMMASITGRTRHLFGPDAMLMAGTGDVSSGISLGIEKGVLAVLRGKETGLYPINDIGIGLGSVSVSFGLEVVKLYSSSGRVLLNDFYGSRWELNMSLPFGAGVTGIYSKHPVGGGFTVGYGVGASASIPFPLFNLNRGVSTGSFYDLKQGLRGAFGR